MFNSIVNPETNRHVSIHNRTGQKVIRKYVQQQANGKGASPMPKKKTPSFKGPPASPKTKHRGKGASASPKPKQPDRGKGASASPVTKRQTRGKGASASPKKVTKAKQASQKQVWIGELGDVRETKEGQVVAWALTSASPKKVTKAKQASQKQVWIGDIGDIRETKDGQLVAWATVDNTMFGKPINFIPDAYQVMP